jgi:hypothetical protein
MSDKIWFRHRTTGELAYLLEQNGIKKLKPNRPNDPTVYDLPIQGTDGSFGAWELAKEKRVLNKHQIATVAYAADYYLCKAIGVFGNKDWMNLKDEDRISFVNNGPKTTDEDRLNLYRAIVQLLASVER